MLQQRVMGFQQILLFWKLDGMLFLEKQVFHFIIQPLTVCVVYVCVCVYIFKYLNNFFPAVLR